MDRKKQAAALAAVYSYMTETDEDRGLQMVESPGIPAGMPPGPPPNIWGLAGRQFMMQANTMMQMRMFK